MNEPRNIKVKKVESIHTTFMGEKTAALCLILSSSPATYELFNSTGLLGRLLITDVIPHKSNLSRSAIYFRNYNNREIVEHTSRGIFPPGSTETVFSHFLEHNGVTKEGKFVNINDFNADLEKELDETESDSNITGKEFENSLTAFGTFKLPLNHDMDSDSEKNLNETVKDFIEHENDVSEEKIQGFLDEILNAIKDEHEEMSPDGHIVEMNELQLVNILKENLDTIEEQQPQTLYRLNISTAEAHLAELIHSTTQAPAFVCIAEDDYNALTRKEKQDLNNYTLLELPFPNTNEFYETTAYLNQEITGEYKLSITGDSMNQERGEILSTIIRLAYGDEQGVTSLFSHLNPLKKALLKVEERTTSKIMEKPSQRDLEYCYFAEAVNRLYAFTTPETIAAIIQNETEKEDYLEEVDALNSLLKGSGLEESFTELLGEHNEASFNFLTPPTVNSSFEEVISYYSAPLTKENFPENMRGFVHHFEMPLLYSQNWATGNLEGLKVTDSNLSEIVIAKLLMVAVRFARLKTIVDNKPSTNIKPLACVVRGMSHPQESLFWVYSETLKHFPETSGKDLFMEVFIESLDINTISEYDVHYLLNTSLALLLHRLGHTIPEELGDKEQQELIELIIFSKKTPNLRIFFDNIAQSGEIPNHEDYENEVYDDDDDGDDGEHAQDEGFSCGVLDSLLIMFQQIVTPEDLRELGAEVMVLIEKIADTKFRDVEDPKEKLELKRQFYKNLFAG